MGDAVTAMWDGALGRGGGVEPYGEQTDPVCHTRCLDGHACKERQRFAVQSCGASGTCLLSVETCLGNEVPKPIVQPL